MGFLQVAKLYWDKAQPEFPDDVDLYRWVVMKPSDYYSYILEKMNGESNAYTHFYSKTERKTGLVSEMLVDVDNEDKRHPLKPEERHPMLTKRWNGMKLFLYIFWDYIELYFTGKGFHVYVHIPPTPMEDLVNNKDILYLNLTAWLQSQFDKGVFLSLDRECRIPLTKHARFAYSPEEPPRWKVPLHYCFSIDDILARALMPQTYTAEFYYAFTRPVRPIAWETFLRSPPDFIKQA